MSEHVDLHRSENVAKNVVDKAIFFSWSITSKRKIPSIYVIYHRALLKIQPKDRIVAGFITRFARTYCALQEGQAVRFVMEV